MGLTDRFARKVAEAALEISKAGVLDTASPMNEAQLAAFIRQQSNQNNADGSTSLPRDPTLPAVPFGPSQPINPGAINIRDPRTGRPDPRQFEYQVAQNINLTATRPVPFATLRAAADNIDIMRRCIEVLKAKASGLNWDIVIAEDAQEKIISDIGGNRSRATEQARSMFNDDINRAREFWEQPDPSNGLTFKDWLNIAIEEVLVIDALAIWPQKTVGDQLLGLQILDGSTIKPLIDERGMRPQPPYPAYQQILYGFPRSEFSAPSEDEKADGEFSSDELAYFVRNRRTMSVYGYSPTERALPLADIYLRRQQWLRAEYTDGVTPELMMTTDANFGNNPNLLRAYENVFNSDLAGQLEQRKRVRLLPIGMTPIQFDGYGERFKSEFDEYLVTSMTGHYGVQPSEIGYAPKGGLGGAGHQEGQASSSEVIGLIPLANWLGQMITSLSYTFLGMPRELEFKFMPSNRQDTKMIADTRDVEANKGGWSINEMRSAEGKPLIDAPEADMPMIVVGNTGFFLTDGEGLKPFQPAPEPMLPSEGNQGSATEPTKPAEKPSVAKSDEIEDELRQFLRWVRKSPERPFNFDLVPPVYAEVLNKFVEVKDYDSARWYAERYLA